MKYFEYIKMEHIRIVLFFFSAASALIVFLDYKYNIFKDNFIFIYMIFLSLASLKLGFKVNEVLSFIRIEKEEVEFKRIKQEKIFNDLKNDFIKLLNKINKDSKKESVFKEFNLLINSYNIILINLCNNSINKDYIDRMFKELNQKLENSKNNYNHKAGVSADTINQSLIFIFETKNISKDKINLKSIKERYKILAKRYHPDMVNGDEEKFKELNNHYQLLLKKFK